MSKIKIITWALAVILIVILFLSTKNMHRFNLIIGFEAVLILIFSLKIHISYYKIAGKIY